MQIKALFGLQFVHSLVFIIQQAAVASRQQLKDGQSVSHHTSSESSEPSTPFNSACVCVGVSFFSFFGPSVLQDDLVIFKSWLRFLCTATQCWTIH